MFHMSDRDFLNAERILRPLGLPLAPKPQNEAGFLAATLVETEAGWCPAGRLVPGMAAQTFDGGLARLADIRHRTLMPGQGGLIRVPGGALDNCEALLLMPGQPLLIADPIFEEMFDASAVIIRAHALVGLRGIGLDRPGQPVDMVTLRFAADEAIFANSGALIFCAAQADQPVAEGAFFPEPAAQDVLLALAGRAPALVRAA